MPKAYIGHTKTSTMASSPYFTIISVNFKSAWALSVFFGTLFAAEEEKDLYEVIVINNDEQESQFLAHLSGIFPIQIIENGGNKGFGQGSNEAVSCARGRVVGFLNPDMKWRQPFLATMKDFFEKQTASVIMGVPLMNESGAEEAWSKGSAPSLWWLIRNNLPYNQVFRQPGTLDWVSGGSLFLRKEQFLNLGGFDKDFFLYFEDVDLCLRGKQSGAQVVAASFGPLTHSGGKSFSSRSQQKKRYYTSQIAYFQKHRPRGEYLFVRLFHRIFHLI